MSKSCEIVQGRKLLKLHSQCRRKTQNQLIRKLDMALPEGLRRGSSVNGAGRRSIGTIGRSMHLVLEDCIKAVKATKQLRGQQSPPVTGPTGATAESSLPNKACNGGPMMCDFLELQAKQGHGLESTDLFFQSAFRMLALRSRRPSSKKAEKDAKAFATAAKSRSKIVRQIDATARQEYQTSLRNVAAPAPGPPIGSTNLSFSMHSDLLNVGEDTHVSRNSAFNAWDKKEREPVIKDDLSQRPLNDRRHAWTSSNFKTFEGKQAQFTEVSTNATPAVTVAQILALNHLASLLAAHGVPQTRDIIPMPPTTDATSNIKLQVVSHQPTVSNHGTAHWHSCYPFTPRLPPVSQLLAAQQLRSTQLRDQSLQQLLSSDLLFV